jgi:hypothetical protein
MTFDLDHDIPGSTGWPDVDSDKDRFSAKHPPMSG